MNNAAYTRRDVVKGFLVSMAIFQVLVMFLVFSRGFLAGLISAIMLPFLPAIFVFTDWGNVRQGNNAIMMAVLCSALAVTLTLSIKYFDNRIFCLAAHVLLVVYWIMSFGILGMAIRG
jgi:hypothetical protein